MEFNQNKADGGEKPWPWPREGPLLLETIIGGTLTLSRSWCQATTASTTTTTNQPVQEIFESSQGEIKRRLGPVSEAGVSGARARNGPAVKDLNIRGNKHD